jgi:hypothetical protein
MCLNECLAILEQRTLEFVTGIVAGSEPLAWMSLASILKGSNRGFDWAIHGYDSQRVTKSLVEMIGESAKMRILAACHGSVANGFCFAGYDPGFQLLGELTVGNLWIDRRESHRLFTKIR